MTGSIRYVYGMCMKMLRTNICLPVQMLNRLRSAASEKGISMSEMLRRIVDEWSEGQAQRRASDGRKKTSRDC